MPSNQTWALRKALSELMARHRVQLAAPSAVPLSPPTSRPVVLSGLAATLDVDAERLMFAPFAFELPATVPLMYDHTTTVAGRIESLQHNTRGELVIECYAEHELARRCNAFSVSGDVLAYTLHNIDSPNFYARVGKVRLREVSLVPNPVQNGARVQTRSQPTALSRYAVSTLKQFDLSIDAITRMQKLATALRGAT